MLIFKSVKSGLVLILALGGLVAGCASSPRSDVARGLMALGFDRRPATCIADEMDARLPPEQMQTISGVLRDAAQAERDNRSPLLALEKAMTLNDPSLGRVILMASAGCMMVNSR
jgi:hypothetical protein